MPRLSHSSGRALGKRSTFFPRRWALFSLLNAKHITSLLLLKASLFASTTQVTVKDIKNANAAIREAHALSWILRFPVPSTTLSSLVACSEPRFSRDPVRVRESRLGFLILCVFASGRGLQGNSMNHNSELWFILLLSHATALAMFAPLRR